jgi:hypothetical protein
MLALTFTIIAVAIEPLLVAVFHDTELAAASFYPIALALGIPIALFLAALGVTVGLRSRSPSEGSTRLALAQLPLTVAGGVFIFVPDLFRGSARVEAVPFVGALVSLQNAAAGREVSGFALIAATVSIGLAVALSVGAIGAVHTPRAVLRPIE